VVFVPGEAQFECVAGSYGRKQQRSMAQKAPKETFKIISNQALGFP
jgi:hypothetical protein